MDAINHIEKDFSFADGVVKNGEVYGDFIKYVQNLPEVHGYIKEIRKELFTSGEHTLIGETGGINYENAFIYTGSDRKELDMIFHFDMHSVGKGEKDWERKPIDLIKDIKEKMSGWQMRKEEEGWCPLFYSNHDTTRTLSRLGNDQKYWAQSAKMLATLQFTQRGTPFIYYGDEIGMTNAKDFKLEDYRDIAVFNKYKDLVDTKIVTEEKYLLGLSYTSRDNSRTPMQWDDSKNSGFTSGTSWIKTNSNYNEINVENQLEDEQSILNYYRKLIALRNEKEVLVYGNFNEINGEDKEIYSYIRELNGERVLIIVNFFGNEPTFKAPIEIDIEKARLVLSNYKLEERRKETKEIVLKPYEARIYSL
jgi:oligo-1,6-glucosidase